MAQTLPQLIKNYQQQRPVLNKHATTIHKTIEHGQQPSVLFICCSDSRIQPHVLLNTDPGDLFVIRNIANMVPEYDPQDKTGMLASLTMAIDDLCIEHIVVMGHQHCSGIKALCCADQHNHPVYQWMNQGQTPLSANDQQSHHSNLEQSAVALYLDRLRQYPIIQQHPDLQLHGWYYDLEQQQILAMDADGKFSALQTEE